MPDQELTRLRRLYDSAPFAYAELDAGGNIIRANRKLRELTARPLERLIGLNVRKLFAPGTPVGGLLMPVLTSAGNRVIECEMLPVDGKPVPVRVELTAIHDGEGRIEGYLLALQDNTALKLTEDTLQKLSVELSRANLQLGVEISQKDAIESQLKNRIDIQQRISDDHTLLSELGRLVNSAPDIENVYDDLSVMCKELVPFDAFRVASINRTSETWRQLFACGRTVSGLESTAINTLAGTLMRDVVQSGSAMIVQADHAEEIGKRYPGMTAETSAGFRSFLIAPLIASGVTIGALQFQMVAPTYYTRRHKALAEAFAYQIAGSISNSRLFRERTQLQSQLAHSQKMESVGTLAGGLAHDFNNLLSAISSYTELALYRSTQTPTVAGYLQEVRKASARAARLTGQLLAFSGRQLTDPKVFCINDLVFDLEKLLRRLINESIELVILHDADLGMVKMDPTQLEQVLVNLVVNARDAMPDGGKLTIKTSHLHIGPREAKTYVAMPGDYVVLTVSDNGVGMTESVQARIFEPFFTTKDVGKGTGLGLSTSHSIVEQNGGFITVESRLKMGTTFEVHLPRAEHASDLLEADSESTAPPQGTETVLLVEDEPTVRNVAGLILKDHGYTVLEAENGLDALRIIDEQNGGEGIDLLLTDIVMPLLGGRALAARIVEMDRGIKVLYASGYLDDVDPKHGGPDHEADFLRKPFTPGDLLFKVRSVLDRN